MSGPTAEADAEHRGELDAAMLLGRHACEQPRKVSGARESVHPPVFVPSARPQNGAVRSMNHQTPVIIQGEVSAGVSVSPRIPNGHSVGAIDHGVPVVLHFCVVGCANVPALWPAIDRPLGIGPRIKDEISVTLILQFVLPVRRPHACLRNQVLFRGEQRSFAPAAIRCACILAVLGGFPVAGAITVETISTRRILRSRTYVCATLFVVGRNRCTTGTVVASIHYLLRTFIALRMSKWH